MSRMRCSAVLLACALTEVGAKSQNADVQLGKTQATQLGHKMVQGMGNMDHSMMSHSSMSQAAADSGFGNDAMERAFKVFASLPLGESALSEAGWVKGSGCNEYLGYSWSQPGDHRHKPLILYTTEGGQPSGVGVDVYGKLPDEQIPYAVHQSGDIYRINVAFRRGSIMCDGSRDEDVALGDSLIVNPGGPQVWSEYKTMEIPLTEEDSASAGWVRGSCFDSMGWHRFLDTSGGPGSFPEGELSWKAENVFPVVAMYYQGEINAIFFSSWTVQQTLIPAESNQWEPIPLPNPLMCKNMCSSNCHWSGTEAWSTMHIFFRNHEEVKCESGLKCFVSGQGCCEAPKSTEFLI